MPNESLLESSQKAPEMSVDLHPPKPRLTVRVGVTGHRGEVISIEEQDEQLRRYHSSFILTYIMGALAILFAYLGSKFEKIWAYNAIELGLIIAIVLIIFWPERLLAREMDRL